MVRFCYALLGLTFFAQTSSAQSSPTITRDPAALATINQALAAAGGAAAIAAIQDFSGNGQITYYWGGKEITGSVTVRGRSIDQFRLDATLPTGTRSWAVSKGAGTVKEPDGKSTPIPLHNAISLGSLTFPFVRLNQAVNDSTVDAIDQGLTTTGNQQFHQIHIHKNLLQKDPDGSANRLQAADLFFDPQTWLLTAIQDQTHPTRTMTVDVPHSVYFSDYRQVNGVLVPFAITEYMGGQRTWSIQLTDIKFNIGLSDADFQL